MNDILEQFRKEYQSVPIPEELDTIVNRSIKQALHTRKVKRLKVKGMTAAAAILVFLIAINASTTVANAFASIPGIERIIKVLTLHEIKEKDSHYDVDIKTPAITNMENKQLQLGLNQKYLNENKALYDKFQAEIEELKQQGLSEAHIGVDAGYEVKTDNDTIFSIGRYIVQTAASSSMEMQFDTIDKKNQILITLPMLFSDDQYVKLISDNIISQMKEQMKGEEGKIYWIAGESGDIPMDEAFSSIKKDQSFYINKDGKLVIVFNKYEVAPGFMGMIEFVIPTDVIQGDLVSHNYIK
ncbi:DUF3298 and DUF4163 domain-containing protein [Paenibacillus glycanilyticus]|uniref:DUF3298 and DUF4163 domain-containing protein n=1 Tax=Paenibacillus glycanilyticus TaxID=126569 RepID=UPI00203ED160|nr:DUF3298 and DUF4163 domain-containing protein [Paenibacillus glycanilyticus]MCM3628586.1 DUF3298 and DUF4163 domain-containing protein [Paenibacillus glycanilyticus]